MRSVQVFKPKGPLEIVEKGIPEVYWHKYLQSAREITVLNSQKEIVKSFQSTLAPSYLQGSRRVIISCHAVRRVITLE
ncbi:MAG: hypothetical protein WBZ36_30845 [Candidatus Nitrosopolaris sp.]